jgi:HTH-type transcriptional regulator/antitoxin HigA
VTDDLDAPFDPDWVSPPGHTIADLLDARQLTLRDLAELLTMPIDEAERLIQGNLELTLEIAERLAAAFGASSVFWRRREAKYRKRLAQGKRSRDYNNGTR